MKLLQNGYKQWLKLTMKITMKDLIQFLNSQVPIQSLNKNVMINNYKSLLTINSE